jgi:hypothetical protein
VNASLEHAFAAWLTSNGITAPVHPGASAEEFDPESLAVIVSVPDVEHSVGPLHRATVNLVVSGPAYHADLQSYRHTAAAIRQAVEGGNLEPLADAVADQAGILFAGLWVKDSAERIEEDRWIHTLTLVAGLVR